MYLRFAWSVLLGIMLLGSTLCSAATVYYVDAGSAPNGSGSQNHPFNKIQQAIDATSNGDEVRVARGTYFENINFMGKAITIRSEKPANPNWVRATIIDGGAAPAGSPLTSVVTFNAYEGELSILDGFTLTHGMGRQFNVSSKFALANTMDAEVDDLKLQLEIMKQVNDELLAAGVETDGNSSLGGIVSLGGAIYSPSASPTIRNCSIVENSATNGGGIYFWSSARPKIANCTFERNSAEAGGAVYNASSTGNSNSSPIFLDCRFAFNESLMSGGAIHNTSGTGHAVSSPELTRCTFGNNQSSNGGAIANSSGTGDAISNPKFTDCTFTDNHASQNGGAVQNSAGTGRANSNPEFSNCRFVRSMSGMRGGAMHISAGTGVAVSAPTIKYCTFIDSRADFGGALFVRASTGGSTVRPAVSHCKLFSNSAITSGGIVYTSNSLSGVPLELHFDNCVFDGGFAADASICFGTTNFGRATTVFTNCTIANCISSSGSSVHLIGGQYESLTGVYFRNCVVWDNQWQGSSPIVLEGNAVNRHVQIAYSDFQGLGTLTNGPDFELGPGNIELDPDFVSALGQNGIAGDDDDRLSVLPGSSVIDAGDNTALPPDTDSDGIPDRDLDVARNSRFVDDPYTPDTGVPDAISAIVDMGAYEFNCIDDDGDGRVTICHRSGGNLDNGHTITVPISALRTHLVHGDSCGPCN